MADLIDVLDLRDEIEKAGRPTDDLNFESLYDELAYSDGDRELREILESRVYEYFSKLELPNRSTIYDYLILSLREKDIIASFNWDPFLLQAYMRNESTAKARRPQIVFLHGNVSVAVCATCGVAGVRYRNCGRCGHKLQPSKLLYPVRHKNYNTDPFIKSEWDHLKFLLNKAYYVTIFGYGAPNTDVEAKSLMLNAWKDNSTRELAQIGIIDVKSEAELEATWREFFIREHYGIADSVFDSYLFRFPRRSCDSFFSTTLMLEPWLDNPFPKFGRLDELQRWVTPLLEEEALHDEEGRGFSGTPLSPNRRGA